MARSGERLQITGEQLVFLWSISGRRRERHSIRLVGREAKAKIVGLHPAIAVARFAAIARLDKRKQSARRVTSFNVGINCDFELMRRRLRAHPVQSLSVLQISLPSDVVGNFGFG